MLAAKMTDHTDILISLKPKHAEQIFGGVKTVELRRRRPNVDSGTRVWIYATVPVAAIRGHASITKIESASPSSIWKDWGAWTGITKGEFDLYFKDCKLAHAIVLDDVMVMKNSLPLVKIREAIDRFQPPQFYCRLNGAREELRLPSRKYIRVNKRRQAD